MQNGVILPSLSLSSMKVHWTKWNKEKRFPSITVYLTTASVTDSVWIWQK